MDCRVGVRRNCLTASYEDRGADEDEDCDEDELEELPEQPIPVPALAPVLQSKCGRTRTPRKQEEAVTDGERDIGDGSVDIALLNDEEDAGRASATVCPGSQYYLTLHGTVRQNENEFTTDATQSRIEDV